MVADPDAMAVTNPLDETDASVGAALLHVIVRPDSTFPDASQMP